MIGNDLKQYVIDYIDDIKKELYHHSHEVELNSLRKKYIYKDISREELKEDHDRLIEIRKICQVYTELMYDEILKRQIESFY